MRNPCAIPMALNLDEVDRVVTAQRKTRQTYRFAERALRMGAFDWR